MDVSTQTHLHSLRLALLGRLASLHADVDAAESARRQARDAPALAEPHDTKDLAGQQEAWDFIEAQEQRDAEELAATEEALQRLDAGVYGDCCECGEPIGLARLQLLPAARRCASCQRRHEQKLRDAGG